MTEPTPDTITALLDGGPEQREDSLHLLAQAQRAWTPAQYTDLGERCTALLGTAPHAATRSYAALALAEIVRTGTWQDTWTEPVIRWWTREEDLRGFDPEEGWIHAVAHGADLIGEMALAEVVPAPRLLGACSRRLIAPTEFVWADGEDDRVALAAMRALSRAQDEATAVAFLMPVAGFLLSRQPSPVPPCYTNTLRSLRSLLMFLDAGRPVVGAPDVPAHADAVRRAVLSILQRATPHFW